MEKKMIFTTPIADRKLTGEELRMDKKNCLHFGPCGLGKRAMYLNSFYIERRFYICYEDVARVFKKVAMTKGGFTGKGIFASIPYLVVEKKDGTQKQCNFKVEQEVDDLLFTLRKHHPEIPTLSKQAEERLERARIEEEKKYLKELSIQAQSSVKKLQQDKEVLEKRPELYRELTRCAVSKRVADAISPTFRIMALLILIAAILCCVFGAVSLIRKEGDFSIYFLMFGFSILFSLMAAGALPSGKRNKKEALKQWDAAEEAMRSYLKGKDFSLPPAYAHPSSIERMIRSIRMGRAQSVSEAFLLLKEDLRALNADVEVTRKEYEEVIAIKPMFLVTDYQA